MFLLAHKENAVKKFIAKVTQTGVLVEIHFRLCLVFARLLNGKMVQVGSIQTNYMYSEWNTVNRKVCLLYGMGHYINTVGIVFLN